MSSCQITGILYHGKADPSWKPNEQHYGQLQHALSKIRFGSNNQAKEDPPPYGFRGFYIDINNKTYKVYRTEIECVTDKTYGYDSGRTLESILVQTAPVKIRNYFTSF